MEMGSIGSRKVRILGALLFATLVTGCYGPGWGGGRPGYYSNYGTGYYGGTGYYPNSYYTKNVYRGYDRYPQPGRNRSAFGGYVPANEAWAERNRGRTSYGGAGARSGGHPIVVPRSVGHSGGTGGGGKHGGNSSHGH